MFQLVFAVSVFTHLNETAQFLWLKELQRVTMNNGVLLITTHGEHAFNRFKEKEVLYLEGVCGKMALFSSLIIHQSAYLPMEKVPV